MQRPPLPLALARGGLALLLALSSGGCDEDPPTALPPREAGVLDQRPPDQEPPDQRPVDAAADLAPPDLAPPDLAPPDLAPPDAGPGVPACRNGLDDDGDGQVDYPLDPGCSDPDDPDEADPAAQACANGADDDGDGRVDHPEDPGCAGPDDPSEASDCPGTSHDVIDLSATRFFEGTTAGNPAELVACRNNRAPEAVFRFTLRAPVERLVVNSAGSSFDTLISIRRTCADPSSELACDDDQAPGDRTSRAVIERPAPGDYFIILDGFLEEQGPYRLEIRAELADGTRCDPEASGPVTCGVGRVCPEGFCTRSQCANTLDDDGDGRIDHPQDPGCDSVDDDDETSPDPLPQCANGRDDDNDGLIDFPDDPDCRDAADDEEARPPQCRDGIDNDNDGLIDFPADPGCEGPDDTNEFNLEQCRDGVDNDGDGRIDFPNDPGCEGPRDPDETTPDPLPQCANEIDDDGDGLLDFPADADSCFSAADDTEDDPCLRRMPTDITGLRDVRGNTRDHGDDFRPSCAPFHDADSVLLWRVAEDRPLERIRFSSQGSSFDTVVSAFDGCGGEELGCDDDSGPQFGNSLLTLGPQPGGRALFIVVDGGFTNANGIWRLRVTPELAEGARCGPPGQWTCGQGLVCRGEGPEARCLRTACANGLDDDADGLTDWPHDPGCATPSDDDETDPPLPPQCANGFDDDLDGLIDFGEDPGCSAAADDFEGPDCADGIDNNDNGLADFDRDGDGRRDANADPGCACAADPSEDRQPQCADGCDNDGDGVIDLEDPGCDGPEDNSEFHFPQCVDGLDNDGDGLIDFPVDPGCDSEDDPIERDPDPLPQCADGLDNDGDGFIDFRLDGTGDDGCFAAGDDDEAGPCDAEIPLLPPEGTVAGVTAGVSQHTASCIAGAAPEAVWRVSLPVPAFVNAHTFGSDYDTALYARSDCAPLSRCPLAPDPGLDPDAGPPAADAGPDAGPDASPPDPGPDADLDAGPPDAGPPDAGPPDAGPPDAEPELPCVARPTELACNDDTDGLQSQILFDWPGGDLYLFVDGFGGGAGRYRLTVSAILPLGGPCGGDLPAWAVCEAGTACLPDPEAPDPEAPEAARRCLPDGP